MKDKGLQSVPIGGWGARPLGLVSARDALEMMLSEIEYEVMKDYVRCIRYR